MRYAPILLAACALLCGCNDFDPPSLVNKLRVLAIKAEPPELPSGATTTLTPLVIVPGTADGGTDGGAPEISYEWTLCRSQPVPGSGDAVNPDCLATDGGSDRFQPLGTQPTAVLVMPAITNPLELGLPDATGGFYVPVVLRVRAGAAEVDSVVRVRLQVTPSPNHNPSFDGLFEVTGDVDLGGPSNDGGGGPGGMPVAIEDGKPLPVMLTDEVRLRATLKPGSDEMFPELTGDPRAMNIVTVAEQPRFFWYATAGEFSDDVTGEALPDSVLKFDKHPPDPGALVDVWVVAHDDRGGIDWIHRQLQVQ